MTRLRGTSLALLVVLAAAGCGESTLAFGDANSIIAVMSPELWDQVGEDVYEALEPTIHTVRAEKTFTVTYQDPSGPEWGNLRRFRQMLVAGTGEEPWIQEAIELATEPVTGPGLWRAYDVWSRGQQVTIILLPEEDPAQEVRRHVGEINRVLDEQYRSYARNRMFMTGVDTALADTLASTAGFSLTLPRVYRWRQQDSLYLFRNDNPDPSELLRQISVTWKAPIPPDMQPDGILQWRAETALAAGEPQDMEIGDVAGGPFEFRGWSAYQIQAIWKNPPDLNWPAAGPFITRAIICREQDRMYLVDAWLYAPGKEKYEYMIQLETILDSFRCGA